MVTRILAAKNDETFSYFKEVDLDGENSPLIYCKDTDRFCSAVDCKDKEEQKTHELEIAVHVTEEDCRWWFENTKVEYLDHSQVNKPYTQTHTQTLDFDLIHIHQTPDIGFKRIYLSTYIRH